MKKLLLISILFVFGCMGFQYKTYKLEDKIVPNTRVNKVLKSENETHAVRYGVRFTIDACSLKRMCAISPIVGLWSNNSRITRILF